jgi:hypothetical protein
MYIAIKLLTCEYFTTLLCADVGTTLCLCRLGSLELRGGDVQTDLFGLASRHYSAQMAQQFATRVLGLDVLGNPLLAASPGADPAEVIVLLSNNYFKFEVHELYTLNRFVVRTS